MDALIEAICRKEGLRCENIQPLHGGQVNRVYRIGEDAVLRIGAREDARLRLRRETDLLQSLPPELPAPKVLAFGELEGQVYQVQRFIPGQKLYAVWRDLSALEQEAVIADLAACMEILHGLKMPRFGLFFEDDRQMNSWAGYLSASLARTLEDLASFRFRMFPGIVELAKEYFEAHQQVLADASPVLVHGDLSFVNILVHEGKLSALIDFEYAMQAPRDYELWVIEAFCLYPNDYAEEENEVFCTGDFARVFPLLQKHAPGLFATPHLRERVNLYHLEAALGSYTAWRKANLPAIPPEKMASKEFYLARIANFIFRRGVRLF